MVKDYAEVATGQTNVGANFSLILTELESSSQFSPKVSMALQFHKMKLLTQLLTEPMYLLDQKTPIKFEILNLLAHQQNWQNFP